MSTKLVPLTTRPLSTSRHGMTRLSTIAGDVSARHSKGRSLRPQHGLSIGVREASLEQGLAGDDPDEVVESEVAQYPQVLQCADPGGDDEGAFHHAGDPPDLVEI